MKALLPVLFLGIFFLSDRLSLQTESQTTNIEAKELSLPTETAKQSISFTLRNTTAKSISLRIPGVMNPNLSPFSNSGVSLKIGQEIIYKDGKKKRVLLVVSEELEGTTVNVAKEIKRMKSRQ